MLPYTDNKRIVNHTSGVWICSLAMNIAYSCIHCVYHECYFREASLEGTRVSCRSRSKATINEESPDKDSISKCNHSILEKFSDLSYFLETFQKKIDNEKYPLSKICSFCKYSIVLKSKWMHSLNSHIYKLNSFSTNSISHSDLIIYEWWILDSTPKNFIHRKKI